MWAFFVSVLCECSFQRLPFIVYLQCFSVTLVFLFLSISWILTNTMPIIELFNASFGVSTDLKLRSKLSYQCVWHCTICSWITIISFFSRLIKFLFNVNVYWLLASCPEGICMKCFFFSSSQCGLWQEVTQSFKREDTLLVTESVTMVTRRIYISFNWYQDNSSFGNPHTHTLGFSRV